MTREKKKQLKAVGKIALGTARMVSGVATSIGVGLLGRYLRLHSPPQVRQHIGKLSFQGGKNMFDEGCRELKS